MAESNTRTIRVKYTYTKTFAQTGTEQNKNVRGRGRDSEWLHKGEISQQESGRRVSEDEYC